MDRTADLDQAAEFIALAQRHGWHARPFIGRHGDGLRAHKTGTGRAVEILTVEWAADGTFAHGRHSGAGRYGCAVIGVDQARQILAQPRQHYAPGPGRGHEVDQ